MTDKKFKGKVYLVHGWDGNPEEPMFKWIGDRFIEKGFEFIASKMPNPEEPKINDWLNKLKEVVNEIDGDTIFIGHSVGCQAILRYIETLDNIKIGKLFLIAPWMKLDQTTIEEEGEEVIEIARPWMEIPINFEKVRKACGEIICFFSDNDVYVPLSEEEFFKENLNAKTMVLSKRGHFDPHSGIKDLPEILEFIK